ncbi:MULTISPECIES: hypothetical protein [Pseudonocardia]|jgi:hypothetical protein|uniref:Uncharacterized protein n=1 Tax=Pseudonocardia alni subsp. carboxydivorans TaxID=415010 RepID=A0ABU9A8D0_PSEA5|nr:MULTISPECIES: hypothetical protein [Pseudonocardia]NWJ73347.1 hypothetical protein [Pseudonocardia pini]ALE79340.1 hypothetical protein WY02_13885 [Pseudonocardia sp. AL041005-10]MBO4240846.1 hypothetical protein [Pseudonocardia alni]MCM3845458.1 hypothetical protein [Pseudonocardia sp. DR1-2]WFG44257.1 hypothetical protein PaSha_13280 [Pseudonocardia alni]
MAAKPAKQDRIHPEWPHSDDGDHPVTELLGSVQGNMSPFGDIEFPVASVPYEHPVTEINR